MLKTGLGTRIGNWDEASQSVVYPDTAATVVGGADGLKSTQPKFQEYFAAGDEQSLDTYWSLLNSFTISYRSPIAGGGNDGPNNPAIKRWIKTYHVGPIGEAKDDQEFFSAFEWDEGAGKGVLVDSAAYPHTYAGSVDGDDWAMTPATQRGNYAYLAFPGPGTDTPDSYKAQMMDPSQAYWLTDPWKAASWGDAQGNRANRYLGVVANLDGTHTSAVSQRGYYARTAFAAYTVVDGEVVLQAAFDSADPDDWALGGSAYDYQNRGNHFTTSADLDGDGRDEIVMKAMVLGLSADGKEIEPLVLNGDVMPTIAGMDGKAPAVGVFEFATDEVRNNPLNEWAPLRHGDRSALLPVDADDKIMHFSGSEEHLYDDLRNGRHYGWIPGPEAHDPLKGRRLGSDGEIVVENSMIYGRYQQSDDEGSVAGNFSNRWPGAQAGSAASTREVRSLVDGRVLTTTATARGIAQGLNAIWFGSGLTHMAVNGANISTVNDETFAATQYLATGLTSTGSKSTPTLKADLLGDWREELVLRASGNRLAIVTTLAPTQYGIRTLMHDPMYRNGVANKNTGYDQVGFASFYLGDEAELPSQRTDITVPQRDLTAPTVTVKTGAGETIGTAEDGYEVVSFKLFDEHKVDRLTLNGVEKDLVDNTWSDLNGVRPGVFGAVLGANELRVFDVAGNVTTVTFTLVEPAPPAHPAWDAKATYDTGDTVTHNGKTYVAQWWTRNQTPGTTNTGPWMEQGTLVPAAGDDIRTWTSSWTYKGGETVAHNGHTWKAKWWTRNQTPGTPHGPWEDLGTY
ncbi:hypothetical protein H9L22_16695 [Tessaracoccus defluvii]|uniref:Chitin-binding type-3 domain-containing protein n=2 Tax=Tessaracoccus defluvii TaxID=1285901 RepID=A0A7H0HAV2_9ACTN|nr:hypothetical protein H9L22_16695 [Tessaracoccus defluvii]